MKKNLLIAAMIVGVSLATTWAQTGRHPALPGPKFDGAMAQLFGDNSTFSATVELQSSREAGDPIIMPGKLFFAGDQSRFEMNLSETKGLPMPPDAIAHMKAMGMDTMISVSQPDQQRAYVIYPGLHSFAEVETPDSADSTNSAAYKITSAELGNETVGGHACVKNQVDVTDPQGTKHEFIVWNAGDLKKFPVKIISHENGQETTLLFTKISFEKPAASNFETPASFTKYPSIQAMMQTEMIKRMGGGMAKPAGP